MTYSEIGNTLRAGRRRDSGRRKRKMSWRERKL